MKKYLYILLAGLIIFLSGYLIVSQLTERVYFSGESKHWKASIDYNFKKFRDEPKNQEEDIFLLHFKGSKPDKVGVFDFECKAPNGSSWSGHVLLNKYGSYQTQGGGNGYVFKKGDKFYLTIKWSGQNESILIK